MLMQVRHAISGRRAGGAILVAAAMALVLAPVPGSGCPSALVAYTAGVHRVPVGDAAPAESAGLIAARSRLNEAEAAVSALDAVDATVAEKDAAATAAEDKATEAENAADEAEFSGLDPSSNVDSAELDVEMAESDVETYENQLQDEQDMLDTDRANGYDTSYQEESIKQVASDLEDAKKELAAKKAALKAAKADAATAASASKARTDAAKALRAKAVKARAAAEAAQNDADQQREAAEAERDDAESSEAGLAAAHQQAVNAWTHARTQTVAAVRALNAEAADCKAAGTRDGAAAAALLVTGLLLLVPFARIRRPGRPWWLRRASRSR